MRSAFFVGAISLGLSLLPSTVAQPPNDTVGGQIVNALNHKPIAGAAVVLRDSLSPRIVAEATSDPNGRFKLDAVPAGRYRLTGSADGYVTASYLQHDQYSSAVVTGAGLDTGSLVLEMTPAGRIIGRVTDENGEPMQLGASIRLFRHSPDTGETSRANSAEIHEDGQYSFENLSPGVYYLAASGTPWYAIHAPGDLPGNTPTYRTSVDPSLDVAFPLTYFPNVNNSKDASPITLHNGDVFTANMQLSPKKAMSLSFAMPEGIKNTSQGPTLLPQLTQTIFGMEEPLQLGIQMFNGKSAVMTGIPAGQYHIRTLQQRTAQSGFTQSSSDDVDLTTSSLSVDLSKPSAMIALVATLHTSDGKSFPPKSRINLSQTGTFQTQNVELDEQGKAIFKVMPGTYQVNINANGRPTGILGITLNGNHVSDGRIHIGETATNTMDVVASHSIVRLDGVTQRDAKPMAGCMMVLVPAGKNTADYLFHRTQSDLDGSFTLNQVIPGDYLLLAIDDGWKLHYTDLNALRPYLMHALPVAVPDNGSTHMYLTEAVIVQASLP